MDEKLKLKLDREFRNLLQFGNTELDLRYACGKFITFRLQGHKVIIDDDNGITSTAIRDYFQSKMEKE